jgi:hypothetical protein
MANNDGPNIALRSPDGLNPTHRAYIDEYMRNGRVAGKAYATVKGVKHSAACNRQASRWMATPAIVAEIDRRVAEYSETAGIERVEVLETLRDMLRFDPAEVFNERGGILPPGQWPEAVKRAVTGYNAGTVTAAEKITFESRLAVCKLLLEELKPASERRHPEAVNNVQINVDKMMVSLREAANASLPAE